jgi:hypothetical protein
MLIILKRWFLLAMIVAILGGCASSSALNKPHRQPALSDLSEQAQTQEPSDRELMNEILSIINNNEKEPDYEEVKICLQSFVAQYPQSEWVAPAQALMATLNKMTVLQTALISEKTRSEVDHAKLSKELNALRDGIRKREEEHSSETARLQQENDQLKKDIEQLKNLEIRLEKRGKRLR